MDIHNLKGSQYVESNIKKNFPQEYKTIISLPPTSWKEKLYWYLNGIQEIPVCPVCCKPTKFHGAKSGYSKYCGYKCRTEDTLDKMKATKLKRYGDPYYNNQSKAKETAIKKYGCLWTQTQQFKDKAQATKERLYGDPHYTNQLKAKVTCIQKYGVPNAAMCDNIRAIISAKKRSDTPKIVFSEQEKTQHRRESQQKISLQNHPHVIRYNEAGDWICKCPYTGCDKCKEKLYTIKPSIYYDRNKNGIETCTHLLPIQPNRFSALELKIRNWLTEMGVNYTTNDRRFGLEMDLYIPDLKLAIEVNGYYWHSSKVKNKEYHINKSLLLADHGIRCIFVWDDYKDEDIREFLHAIIKDMDLSPWIEKWFPDIDGWPADFGLIDGQWQEHRCIHGGHECYDAGRITIVQ